MIKIHRKLGIFLFALVFLDLLILSFINRKSICIQTHWIDEVVWHFSENEALNIYTCEDKIKTSYNEIIADSVQTLNQHIIQVEKKLKNLGGPVRGFRLHILNYSENYIQVNGSDLNISANLISEKNGEELIRGLVKSWILQQQKVSGLDLFRMESLTNLLLGMIDLKPQQNLEWINWVQASPFHLGSYFAWCNSPLKRFEYDSLCLKFERQSLTGGFSYQLLALWFAKNIEVVYESLSLENRLLLLKNFHLLIENLSLSPSQNNGLLSLTDIVVFIRKEISAWGSVFRAVKLPEVSEQLLKSYQIEENKLNTYWENLDFIFYQEEDWSSEQIKRFQDLAITEKDYKFIGLNAKGFWLWPFVGSHDVKSMDFKIKSKYVIYQSCSLPKVKDLLMKWSDRILWVQSCEREPKTIIFNGFLHKGIQYFSLENPDIKFISFYLPALQFFISKNPFLKNSVFAFKSMKNQQSRLAELASWKSVLWSAEFRAYEVSATISVIDWFKLSDGTWPEIMINSENDVK
jgi:hypothetical protein